MLEWIHNIDAQILLFIQQYLRSDLFTWLWKGITFLGDGGWFWIVLGLLFLFPKKTRKAGVTALLALAIGAVVTNLCLKDLVARIRPYDSVEGLVPLVARLKDYTFQTCHTCASLSRLYVGVHYPTDVLAGALVGTFSALAALKLEHALVRYYEERKAK